MLLTLGYNTNLTAEAIAIHSLALSLFTLYSLLNYLKLLGGEDRPCSSDRLRYKLRMKPFFHISTPELPAYVDVWDPVYASGGSQEQCNKAEDALKTAKEQITVLKSLGPQEMKYVGNEVEYQNHVRQMLRSCIATGVAIATVRAACAKYASKDEADSLHKGVLRSVLNVEIPNPETRYAARWAVPKITQKKAKS
ncbi:N-alpha-acetyltransferase, non-catalitic subunit [Cryomyces antarcticus]|uniref:N-alpha-acetyltransferase, non-catalitic subunit n=1 Tax=Cryomyces antarcticus TaxID=329879 RepID=A0ABR0LYQ5_9PEZI|nr:N-alpha-acetyltransferase, non-catalitic subunit [Cryomyces antarcticus]KAK5253229.1 N-alpha-acetyltransferase, non-catalitic subunit [Cryomyces antarcticus]